MPNPLQALREPQRATHAKTWATQPEPAAGRYGVIRWLRWRRWPGLVLIATLLVLLGAWGCKSSSQTTGRPLCVAGSTSVQPFAEKLAEVYTHRHPGVRIDVQGGGSSAGIYAATQGAADLGPRAQGAAGRGKKTGGDCHRL